MSNDEYVKALEHALGIALERWREADYHWTLEFVEAPKDVRDHIPGEFDGGSEYLSFRKLIRHYPDMCETCNRTYADDGFGACCCSNSFHCCRDCHWVNGRVRVACPLHLDLQQGTPE